MGGNSVEQLFFEFAVGKMAIFTEEADKPFITELFMTAVCRFRDSVSHQHHAIAARKSDFSSLVLRIVEHSQNSSSFRKPFDDAIPADENRRHMTGIGVTQRTLLRIENSVKQRGET